MNEGVEASGLSDKPFATFDCRYKKALGTESIPLNVVLKVEDIFNKHGRSDDYYFAAGVAAYGMILRKSPYKGDATIDLAGKLVKGHLGKDPYGYRSELLKLIEKSK